MKINQKLYEPSAWYHGCLIQCRTKEIWSRSNGRRIRWVITIVTKQLSCFCIIKKILLRHHFTIKIFGKKPHILKSKSRFLIWNLLKYHFFAESSQLFQIIWNENFRLKHQTTLATHFLHLIGLAEVQDE